MRQRGRERHERQDCCYCNGRHVSGIGEVAALALAKMGARIIAVGRSKARGDATLARLSSSAPGVAHALHLADLSRLGPDEMRGGADRRPGGAHRCLINNAGAAFGTRQVTEDGVAAQLCAQSHGVFRAGRRVARAGPRQRRPAASSTPLRPHIWTLPLISTISSRKGATVP